jgi:hypothetical protein
MRSESRCEAVSRTRHFFQFMKPIRILNLGAGVQSTTIALMGAHNWDYWQRSEPLPYPAVGLIDHAIFADTQDEPKAVYSHLEWLRNKCGDFFTIHTVTAGNLGDHLVKGINSTGRRFVSIPAYTSARAGGKAGMTRRQCTKDYKVMPIERFIRRTLLGLIAGQRLPKEASVVQIFGLSYDEAGRIARVKGRYLFDNWLPEFPLFHMEMTRRGCVAWLQKQGIPHQVPRSACVYCPYKTDEEWRKTKEDSEAWARAIEIDRAIRDHDSTCTRGLNQLLYLHDACMPLESIDFDSKEEKDRKRGQRTFGFLQECEGMCGV